MKPSFAGILDALFRPAQRQTTNGGISRQELRRTARASMIAAHSILIRTPEGDPMTSSLFRRPRRRRRLAVATAAIALFALGLSPHAQTPATTPAAAPATRPPTHAQAVKRL